MPKESGLASVPIGVPGDNTKVFLLNSEGRHVPIGEIGEMFLSGAQVASYGKCRGTAARHQGRERAILPKKFLDNPQQRKLIKGRRFQ